MSPPVRGSTAPRPTSATPESKSTETVRKGDSWQSVAERLGVSVENLQRANPGAKPSEAPVAGQQLNVPAPAVPTPAAAAASPDAAAPAPSAAESPHSAEGAQEAWQGRAADEARLAGQVQQRLTGATAEAAPAKPAPSQHVDDAMNSAGPHADNKVLAGAASDMGQIRFEGEGQCTKGRERLRDVYRNAVGQDVITPRTEFGRTGQPKLYAGKDAQKQPVYRENSWCGVYATDLWKRAGVPCKWQLGTGIVDDKGKPMPHRGVPRSNDASAQEAYRAIKPGDIITINTQPAEPGKSRPRDKSGPSDLNHHAIVKDRVFETGSPPRQVTCPPEKEPADGKVVGFHTYNGNMGADPANPERGATCEAYVSVTPTPVDGTDSSGNTYEKRISTHYPLPGSSQRAAVE